MTTKTRLALLFSLILLAMILGTGWATLHQSVQDWGGLSVGPDRYWTLATLLDAYCGFITFYAWVLYKEPRALPRVAWFVGNMAMACYVLLQLRKLRPGDGAAQLLSLRNA